MDLPKSAWTRLERPARYEVKTESRERPENVKERIVRERNLENISSTPSMLLSSSTSPSKCKRSYHMVVVRKNLTIERGEREIFDDITFFFYITNDRKSSPSEIVFDSNSRANQENLIEQLKNGVRALNMPVDNLVSNWAYMVMVALSWNLKAWFSLTLPVKGRVEREAREGEVGGASHGVQAVHQCLHAPPGATRANEQAPCLSATELNPYQHVFFRAIEALDRPLVC